MNTRLSDIDLESSLQERGSDYYRNYSKRSRSQDVKKSKDMAKEKLRLSYLSDSNTGSKRRPPVSPGRTLIRQGRKISRRISHHSSSIASDAKHAASEAAKAGMGVVSTIGGGVRDGVTSGLRVVGNTMEGAVARTRRLTRRRKRSSSGDAKGVRKWSNSSGSRKGRKHRSENENSRKQPEPHHKIKVKMEMKWK